jgi:hypothetical protein
VPDATTGRYGMIDLAYIWLCKEHETDLQSPMLVSQAVLIRSLELSASISMPTYLVLSQKRGIALFVL